MSKLKAVKLNPVGRPTIVDGEATIRVGFSIPEGLWTWFMKQAEKRELSYSALFRNMVEKEKKGLQ